MTSAECSPPPNWLNVQNSNSGVVLDLNLDGSNHRLSLTRQQAIYLKLKLEHCVFTPTRPDSLKRTIPDPEADQYPPSVFFTQSETKDSEP
jgi:hypothetical protein